MSVHAIEDAGATPSISMEIEPGVMLQGMLQFSAVDQHTALECPRQTAETVREARASGLVHGT
jgi:hypothetical protein